MRKFIWYILNKLKVASIVQLVLKSSLKEDGWFKSYYEKQAIDKKGNPIPWCSYPFIKFIEPRLKPSFEVFEYGCGNSTIWFANKVKTLLLLNITKSGIIIFLKNYQIMQKLYLKSLCTMENTQKLFLMKTKNTIL